MKGDEWQVHGGGFYHMMKYMVAPAQMPDSLTWFKWEAYTTWLSGFALLVLVYYLGADLFLIDKSVLDLDRRAGGGVCLCQPGRRLAYLRRPVPVAARQTRSGAGAGRLRVSGRR